MVSLAVSSLLPAALPPAISDRFRFPFGSDSLSYLVGRGGRAGARLGISPAPPATLSTMLSRLPDVTGSDNRADYKCENQTVKVPVRSIFWGQVRKQLVKGLFTRTVSVPVSISVKIYHCANGNGPFDGQNRYRTHSAHQTVRLYWDNVNFTETDTETETLRVNKWKCRGATAIGALNLRILRVRVHI